ncbi:MAG: phage tail tape measure protein [Planctomycetota bacterium]
MIQVAKALNDPIANLSALSRAGIQFSESQKAVINELVKTNRLAKAQSVILKELESQYGGSAVAARDTLGGALAALRNEWDDLLKSIGQGQSGALRDLVEWLIDIVKYIQDVNTPLTKLKFGFERFWEGIKYGGNSAYTVIKWLFNELAAYVGDIFVKITRWSAHTMKWATATKAFVGLSVDPSEETTADELYQQAMKLERLNRKLRSQDWEDVKRDLANLKGAYENTLDIIDRVEIRTLYSGPARAAAAARVSAEDRWLANLERDIWASVDSRHLEKDDKKDAPEAVLNRWGRAADEVKRAWEDVGRSIGDSLGGALESAIFDAESLGEVARNLFNDITRMVFRSTVTAWLSGAGSPAPAAASALGNVFSHGRLVPFANGGIVARPTAFQLAGGRMGIMGEAGPEAVMPLARGRDGKLGVKSESRGAPIIFNINTPDADSFCRSKAQIVADMKRAALLRG